MTLTRTERTLASIAAVVVMLALASTMFLSLAYHGEVKQLRKALTVACGQRLIQHDASHKAVGASLVYYRSQLRLLNENYATQLRIIRSYPKATQPAAIRRVNDNRADLQNVIATTQAAFLTQTTFTCAH